MRTQVVSGLCLMASAAACPAGALTAPSTACPAGCLTGRELTRIIGAWLAVVAIALIYRDIARRTVRAPSAVAMALLGVVASAATVAATFRLTGPVLPPVLVGGAAIGLAGLAYAAVRAGLLGPAAGVIAAVLALLSTLTADPGAPYLLGAGPLGAALLARALGPPPPILLAHVERTHLMRTVYKILAYSVAVEVAIQATVVVLAFAGLGKWVSDGNVFDKAVMESDEFPFPEVVGIIVHGVNGGLVIPVIALLLLIVSFFARIPGGIKFAVLVLALVAVQTMLGYAAHDLTWLGALHGLNAMLLFAAALHTARRARLTAAEAAEAPAATTA